MKARKTSVSVNGRAENPPEITGDEMKQTEIDIHLLPFTNVGQETTLQLSVTFLFIYFL